MSEPFVMYIFVNSDLNMSKGKIAAQCCHIVGIITEEIIRQGYEIYPPPKTYFDYMKWKNQCTKIILRATTEQLNTLMKLQNARHFIDNGERLPENALTVVGFFPGSDISDRVKEYKLL